MKKICEVSGKEFEITKTDLKFYKKMKVPIPKLCPKERQRRRQAFINLNNLYSRKDWTWTKKIISPFSADKDFNVLPFGIWFSDKINGKNYAREFNFSRWFFKQFNDLQKVELRWDRVVYNSENSHWSLNISNSKNTYLVIWWDSLEDTYYCDNVSRSRDVCDGNESSDISLWYEIIQTRKSNRVLWCYLWSKL